MKLLLKLWLNLCSGLALSGGYQSAKIGNEEKDSSLAGIGTGGSDGSPTSFRQLAVKQNPVRWIFLTESTRIALASAGYTLAHS